MSDQTKVNALVKLNSFTVKVGYPDKWKDYSKLEVDPSKTLYDNMKAASLWSTKRNLEKYGKPVDREEWEMTPQTVNAYYNPLNNEIVFPLPSCKLHSLTPRPTMPPTMVPLAW